MQARACALIRMEYSGCGGMFQPGSTQEWVHCGAIAADLATVETLSLRRRLTLSVVVLFDILLWRCEHECLCASVCVAELALVHWLLYVSKLFVYVLVFWCVCDMMFVFNWG
jgi:hypothetical protein